MSYIHMPYVSHHSITQAITTHPISICVGRSGLFNALPEQPKNSALQPEQSQSIDLQDLIKGCHITLRAVCVIKKKSRQVCIGH